MSHKRFRSALLILAVVVLLPLLFANAAQANDPVLWKDHCPSGYDVKTYPATDWGGNHALCVQQGGTFVTSDPVLWKAHCPSGFYIQTIPAIDWGGNHALCIQQADAEKATCEK